MTANWQYGTEMLPVVCGHVLTNQPLDVVTCRLGFTVGYYPKLHMSPILKSIYYSIPRFVRSLMWALLQLKVHCWILSGKEASSNLDLTIFYCGSETNKQYIISLAFGQSFHNEKDIGKSWLWQVPDVIMKMEPESSLAMLESPKLFRRLFRKENYRYIPCWISGEIDTTKHEKSDSLQTDIRKIRKFKLNFEITNESSHLHEFYHDMHVPYIKKTFGNLAMIFSYDSIKSQFRKHGLYKELMFITKDGEYIAGILLGYERNTVYLHCLGVKDGNYDYVKQGALGALFYFPVIHSREIGLKKVNFGLCRSFLKDGVLQFKKRRGMQLRDISSTGFLIKPLALTDGVKCFLANNPFVYLEKGDFVGAVFMSNNTLVNGKELEQLYKCYLLDGLSRLVVYHFGEKKMNEIEEGMPHKFFDKVVMSSFEKFL